MALEWVEIIEPRTKERMYANLTTGECAWEPPPGVEVKKSDENQWWELFDVNTSRFYYYNAMSGKTVWHRPRGEGSDIIPLAKLQTMKLNEESAKHQRPRMVCTETQTSPPLSRRHVHGQGKEKYQRSANAQVARLDSREGTPKTDDEARRAEVDDIRKKSSAKESRLPPPGFLVNLNVKSDGNGREERRRETKENGTATMSSSSSLSSPSRRLGGGGVGRSCSFLGRGGGDSSSGGRRSVESTPLMGRRKDSQGATAGGASSGAESLCTPLLFRRQMSQDTPNASALGFSPVKRQGVVLTSGNKQMAVIAPNNACSVNSLRPSRSLHSGLKEESSKKRGKDEKPSDGAFYANVEPKGAARNVQQKGDSWEERKRQQKQQQLLHEFYLRQYELTGYRFLDGAEYDEEGSDQESEGEARRRRQRRNLWKQQQKKQQERQETRPRRGEDDEEPEDEDDDSDEDFADDEGSSREYLNEDAYPEDERETYAALLGKMQQQMQLQDKGATQDVVDHPHLNHPQDHHIYSPVAEVPLFCPPPVSSFAAFSPGAVGRTQAMAAARQEAAASSEGRAEKYVKDNLNVQKRGLFRRNVPIKELLSWSKEAISHPLLVTPDKTLRKFKKDVFKLIQIYMSDRKAKAGATLSSVAHEIVAMGWKNEPVRDELFFLLCKQTTENPRRESLRRGWELMAICLAFFCPTSEFEPYLRWYIEKHRDPELDKYEDVTKWPIHVQISHYATVSQNRLEKLVTSHSSSSPREPVVRDVDRARVQIFRPTMFGSSLEEVMVLQKERFPERKLPWVIVTLAEEVFRLGGEETIGIFREAPDHRDLENTQELLDRFQIPAWTSPLIPASLLKRFFADLHCPLIPPNLLRSCGIFTRTVKPSDFQSEMASILSLLPPLNRLVLAFLISFLQRLLKSAEKHKMTAYNLAVVFTPNLTRMTSSNPMEMQDEALKANSFFQYLLEKMDAKFADNLK